jgi:hypothetical protein
MMRRITSLAIGLIGDPKCLAFPVAIKWIRTKNRLFIYV